jgi:sterol desaturase/sphingolipid hydroxylase (fatty acid hydroxylase superfamily)
VKHEHSEAAYRMLSKYTVDGKGSSEDMVDITKPIVHQVGQLHDRYWTWIHQPLDSNIRLFQSDYLEMFTNTKWFIVPIVWMPLVLTIGLLGLKEFTSSYGLIYGSGIWGMLFGLGSLTWSLLEYGLHRGVFHWQPNPKSSAQITFHFLMHGIHHKTPMDGLRLVFPPLPAIPIVTFFFFFYRALLPWPVFCAFASGKLFGYICYDVIHYHLHHGHPAPNSNYHYRKVYHHNHHYKDGDSAYGISTNLWDYVFGTVGTGPL